jgi:hypothetical protein
LDLEDLQGEKMKLILFTFVLIVAATGSSAMAAPNQECSPSKILNVLNDHFGEDVAAVGDHSLFSCNSNHLEGDAATDAMSDQLNRYYGFYQCGRPLLSQNLCHVTPTQLIRLIQDRLGCPN